MHRLWVHGQNIRQVVVGACKWLYEDRTGAKGCNGSGVTSGSWDGSDGTEVGDMGVGRTGVGWVYAGIYELVDQFITSRRIHT